MVKIQETPPQKKIIDSISDISIFKLLNNMLGGYFISFTMKHNFELIETNPHVLLDHPPN